LRSSNDRINGIWNPHSAGRDPAPRPVISQKPAGNLRSLDRLRSPSMLDGSWLDLYSAAILEIEPSLRRICEKLGADTIKARASEAGVSGNERRELGDALATLRRLKPEQDKPHRRWND